MLQCKSSLATILLPSTVSLSSPLSNAPASVAGLESGLLT